ncbi:tRNA (adenosine(37)-N6)-threonylcarbamoyltransferase complex ATPase subunit type 1 TsaE [Pigmentiphaga sp.]|jgi:ATPase, YjeE family|uniref:tRNA (adenosine(37)-N6)-threonylcarbamoyltransferase complex ATPase subunit type 1 TsaE n=1 Tax=Pigmentiphaga sp. TaxID=1977564 RepID=UPI0025FB969E|nr:tRNA (adenosine(37)-N6)-threonylcarbamoyltransferase complex ATPase subunit type 1 TsaE [Pigmentiphaga sp.]MBX6317198.1 tRNA (adenosine(37)-N6)-threonylcarbamoyltransferase complex ATPase subunit type 1 TsaE [Pigmentiphaga sp.]
MPLNDALHTAMPESRHLHLPDEAATEALAASLAPLAAKGLRIHLHGDLGAGKTTFARALLRAVGVTGRIKSPTFTLVEPYKVSNLYCYHFDFYRFTDPREWLDAGFRDALRDDALVLIEWAERAGGALPAPDLDIALSYEGAGRGATLRAHTAKGQAWLNTISPDTMH